MLFRTEPFLLFIGLSFYYYNNCFQKNLRLYSYVFDIVFRYTQGSIYIPMVYHNIREDIQEELDTLCRIFQTTLSDIYNLQGYHSIHALGDSPICISLKQNIISLILLLSKHISFQEILQNKSPH